MLCYFSRNINFACKTFAMTEKRLYKTDQTTISNLESADHELVLNTIKKLRESGNSAYLPKLIGLLHESGNNEIKKEIGKLLAELKHRDAIPVLIEAIQNKNYSKNRQLLVSACWENGLDYSNHLSLFVDLVIEGNFMVAFEAYTVIINMSGKIPSDIADKESHKIKRAFPEADENKKQLLHDLLHFLPVFEQGIDPFQF